MFTWSPQVGQLQRLMDAAELRHRVISHNLANVNTPGYQRLDVEFEEEFAAQLERAGSGDSVTPQVVREKGLPSRADGNNVDVDREIGQLNRNSLMFETYSQILASQFELMRRAMRRA